MAGTAMCLHLQTSQVELPLQLSCAAFSSAQEASRVSFSPASSSGSVGCETLIRPWQHSISRSRKFGRTMAAVAASTIAESEKLPVEGEMQGMITGEGVQDVLAIPEASEVSRRSFALAGMAVAASFGLFVEPDAYAAKRKPPPVTEAKPEDEKNLSAYDARLLASARRKEVLKANIEKTKAAASKSAGTVAAEIPSLKLE